MNLSIINVSIFGEKEHPNEASVKIVIPTNKILLAPYFVVRFPESKSKQPNASV